MYQRFDALLSDSKISMRLCQTLAVSPVLCRCLVLRLLLIPGWEHVCEPLLERRQVLCLDYIRTRPDRV
jgi:hypothetical protein